MSKQANNKQMPMAKIWVISDGTAGMLAQSLALVQAMEMDFHDVRIFASPIYRLFPQLGAVPFMPISPRRSDRKLGPPWPEVVITCGKRMAGAALAIKRLSGGETKLVHIQDPRIDPSYFDVMVVPEHDDLASKGYEHVIPSRGALNRLRHQDIKKQAKSVKRTMRKSAQPITAVMVGGHNRRYKAEVADFKKLASDIRQFAQKHNRFLYIIGSRRTPKKGLDAMQEVLSDWPHQIWNGEGDNPYPGVLGLAEDVIVTSDSVNMTCEACFTGLPVYTAYLREEEGRIARFHEQMVSHGHTKRLGEAFDKPPVILDQTKAIAEKVMKRLGIS